LQPKEYIKIAEILPNYETLNLITYNEMIKISVLRKYFNTIISYLYKGSERVKQDFTLNNNNCLEGSIIHKVVKFKKLKWTLKEKNINIHVIGSYLIENLIELLKGEIKKR